MEKGGAFDHINLTLDNIGVMSQNRNARVYDCGNQCKIINSQFNQITGYSGARNYDLHVTGSVIVNNSSFINQGVFNKGSDLPSATATAEVLSITGYNGASGYLLYKYDGTTGVSGDAIGSWSAI